MRTNWKAWLEGFVMLALLPVGLAAQNYVYTNNDLLGANTVSAFSWDTTQAPPLVPIGTYSTGGTGTGPGGLYSADRIIVVKETNGNVFLYASNAGTSDIGVFKIVDPTAGPELQLVATTALPTGSSNMSSESGISLAATPDGSYLYAGSTGYGGQIAIYQIDSTTGALTMASPALMAADGPVTSMKVTPLGDLLVVAIKDNYEIQTFKIGPNAALTKASATIQFGTVFTGEDVNCAETYLYAGNSSSTVKVFSITSGTGALAYLSASPVVGSISSNQVVRLSPDDGTLYASNQGSHSVTAFSVNTLTGGLSGGTAVDTGSSYAYPGGLAINADGTLLYAGSALPAVTVFGLGGTTPFVRDYYDALAPQAQGLLSVAAYPPKVCSLPTSLAATLDVSAGPPPSFNLAATLNLGSGGGTVDPLTQPVTLQVGNSFYTYSVTIPAGSFNLHQNGPNAGVYVFQGGIYGATLKVQIAPLSQNQFQISAYVKKVDLTGLANPLTVQVTIGSNTASTSINATITEPLRGPWSAQ